MGGNRRNWTRQLATFAPRFHACASDARGYGESGDYAGPLTFDDLAGDVLRVLDHFGAASAHLIGLSMGGLVALEFHERHPERVRSLTLCAIHRGMSDASRAAREAFLARRRAPLEAGRSLAELAPPLAASLLDPHASDAARAEIERSIEALRPESYLKALACVTHHEFRVSLERIRVPCHFVPGERDPLVPLAQVIALQQQISGAKLTVIPGAGHLVNLEAPEAFDQAVLDFLGASQ